MRLIRSWRQRDRQTYGRDSKLGTLTDLRSLAMSPKRREDSSERALQPGFYIAISSKKRIKTLHLLGSCYMIPGIDYPSLRGRKIPEQAHIPRSVRTRRRCAGSRRSLVEHSHLFKHVAVTRPAQFSLDELFLGVRESCARRNVQRIQQNFGYRERETGGLIRSCLSLAYRERVDEGSCPG